MGTQTPIQTRNDQNQIQTKICKNLTSERIYECSSPKSYTTNLLVQHTINNLINYFAPRGL